jgi:hypothetical protein
VADTIPEQVLPSQGSNVKPSSVVQSGTCTPFDCPLITYEGGHALRKLDFLVRDLLEFIFNKPNEEFVVSSDDDDDAAEVAVAVETAAGGEVVVHWAPCPATFFRKLCPLAGEKVDAFGVFNNFLAVILFVLFYRVFMLQQEQVRPTWESNQAQDQDAVLSTKITHYIITHI